MELSQLNITELRKVVKREAERINREVSRAKLAGREYRELGGLKRFSRAVGTKTRRELISQYNAMQKRTQGGYTRQTLKKVEKQKAQFAKELGLNPEDIKTSQLGRLTKLAQAAKQNDALFYEALKVGVAYGKYRDYNQWREEGRALDTEKSRSAFVTETIKYANKKIREANKQRAISGEKPLPVLRRRALKASAAKTAKSRARKVVGK